MHTNEIIVKEAIVSTPVHQQHITMLKADNELKITSEKLEILAIFRVFWAGNPNMYGLA